MRGRIRWFVLILALSPLLAHAGEGESLQEIRDIGVILKAAQQGSSLDNAVVHGLNFQQTLIIWQKIDVRGAVFLGCKFGGNDESMLVGRGALVFPGFRDLPYDPYRSALYTPTELFATSGDNNSRTLDQQIYDHYAKRGRYSPNVMDALAQRIHDHAIDRALSEYLDIDVTGTPRRKIVAIMGGHSTRRDDPCYRKVALLACSLARQGYLISTGGGPGMMEAGNLGAYLADYGKEAVEDAVTTLASAPEGKSPGYYERVEEVLKKYPKGKDSLAIPTWFYGQEPCNFFGIHIAKYFSNAIREETLLSTASCGVVFTPGSAGTTQEVFMTAAQNHYGSFGYYCPMVFLGKERYAEKTKIYDLLKELAKGREYEKFMMISDDSDELVAFIKRILPRRPFNNRRTVHRVHPCMISESSDVLPNKSGPRSAAGALDLHDPALDGGGRTKVRYLVFFMMFIAVVINYMDRANFTVSIPLIEKQFGFDITQMGRISFIWGLAYALFNFPGGWFADKLGIRKAASFALGWWSIFTILSAVAYSMVSWCVIRGLMGAGEAPIWPINAKATSTWSAPSERARAFTMAGSGQFVGSAFGVFASGWIVHWFGWQWTFIIFGALGLLWIPIWIFLVRDTPQSHPWINQRELRFIQGVSGATPTQNKETHLSRGEMKKAVGVMLTRNGIGVLLTFLCFGYVLFTFLNWLPNYMFETFQLTIVKSASWTSLTFVAGFIGYLVSGPINDGLVAKYGHAKGRKLGAGVPMGMMIVMMLIALETSKLKLVAPTAVLIGFSLLVMNASVGAWAINAVDLAPTPKSSAFVYGVYNGILNLMGAFSSIIVTWIAQRHGFIWAFSSAVVFMAIFLLGLIVVIDEKGIVPAKEELIELG